MITEPCFLVPSMLMINALNGKLSYIINANYTSSYCVIFIKDKLFPKTGLLKRISRVIMQ